MLALEELYSVAARKTDGVVLVAGDVFDAKNVSELERNSVMRFIEKQDRAGMTTIMLNGNHDLLATGKTSLEPLRILAKRLKHTTVVECEIQKVVVEGTTFVLCPPVDRHQPMAEVFAKLAEYLEQNKIKKCVVSAHFGVDGALTETGYSVTGEKLPNLKAVAYWALGDIHRFQKVAPRAFYPGNPLAHKWGENPDKGCLIVDTDDPGNPTFVRLNKAPHLLKVDHLPEEKPDNCLVKVLVAPSETAVMPEWVSATEIVTTNSHEEVVRAIEKTRLNGDVLEGLEGILRNRDLTDPEIEWCLQTARKML